MMHSVYEFNDELANLMYLEVDYKEKCNDHLHEDAMTMILSYVLGGKCKERERY